MARTSLDSGGSSHSGADVHCRLPTALPRRTASPTTASTATFSSASMESTRAVNQTDGCIVPPARTSSNASSIAPKIRMFSGKQPASATLPRSAQAASIRRASMSLQWSVAASLPDLQVDDELSRVQRDLRDLKQRISAQSKKNFLLERDVRYLDSRIALLIQNRMSLDEYFNNSALADDSDGGADVSVAAFPDEKRKQAYGNLFFLLQTEPRLVAHLTRLLTLGEIDFLLQTVMFTLYGNQYDNREEHLLLTMFQSVLSAQFDAATDIGSLLRANTPASRMMTTYTRRGPGQQYLKFVLSDNINQLIAEPDTSLEINALKVYEQMINQIETDTGTTSSLPRVVTQEEAEDNQDVQRIIEPRLAMLTELADRFLDTIIGQLEHVPYGIRWICKQIHSLTRKRYPEATDVSICSLIGGFFFLRYINPAIVTPQSYMIVESQPAQNPRRALTLVAKMLQNLANKPTQNKETYMASLQPYIDANKQRVMKFLLQLCDVPDFYETLEMDQYMALSTKNLSINISINEIYNTHALLLRHLDTICPLLPLEHDGGAVTAGGVARTPDESFTISRRQLRVIMKDLGEAPAQLARKDNKTLSLSLFSRWETAPILFPHMYEAIASKESVRPRLASDATTNMGHPVDPLSPPSNEDKLYLDTKTFLIQIMRKQAVGSSGRDDDVLLKSNPTITNMLTDTSISCDDMADTLDIDQLLMKAALQSADPVMASAAQDVRRSLRILEDRYGHELVCAEDGYAVLAKDVLVDMQYLASLLTKLRSEVQPLQTVYQTICEHNDYLRSQLESYKAYLNNVRVQAGGGDRWHGNSAFARLAGKASTSADAIDIRSYVDQPDEPPRKSGSSSLFRARPAKASAGAPVHVKLSHSQLEKDGVIVESGVPDNRRANIYFNIQSLSPGSFTIGLHYKGRDKPIVEVDMKLDDLLEKQHDNIQYLDLEYVKLNVNKTLHLLNKNFVKR